MREKQNPARWPNKFILCLKSRGASPNGIPRFGLLIFQKDTYTFIPNHSLYGPGEGFKETDAIEVAKADLDTIIKGGWVVD